VIALALVGSWGMLKRLRRNKLWRAARKMLGSSGAVPAFMPAGCGLAVLHGDPAKANADVLLRLPANAVIPEHWHTSAERMVLVAESSRSTTRSGKSRAQARHVRLRAPKAPHTGSCGTAPCVLFIAFESAVDAVPVEAAAK